MFKYHNEEKYLIFSGEGTMMADKPTLLISLPSELHWSHPFAERLTTSEVSTFVDRLHAFLGKSKEVHQVRMYTILKDLNIAWFYGYGVRKFYDVFRSAIEHDNKTFQLEGDILRVSATNVLFKVPVKKLVIDKWLFFSKVLPVFQIHETVDSNGVRIASSSYDIVAREIRKVLAWMDCSCNFAFAQVKLPPSESEIRSRNTFIEDSEYRIV